MAFEREFFDLDLVLPYVSIGADEPAILSALYALQFRDYLRNSPADVRRRFKPLLLHESRMVRLFVVETLSFQPGYRPLILDLKDDPDPQVAKGVIEALERIETLE